MVFVCAMLFAASTVHAFYNPSTGRWLNRDPLASQSPIVVQGINQEFLSSENPELAPALFVRNNPGTYFDAVGLWPSMNHWLLYPAPNPQTHENSIGRTLPMDLPDRLHAALILTFATLEVEEDQSVAGSFKHAMSAPWQSKARARQNANDFVASHISSAQEFLCGCNPDWNQALRHFGLALHTIQDATSPAHAGFQTWYSPYTNPIGALRHLRREGFDPGSESALDNASRWLWTFFKCKAESPTLPSDFFQEIGHD